MELKFFVSGVPNGESLWGPQTDANYFGTLYVPSKENQKFDIRLSQSGNKIYAYYHYLVYNIINDVEGRTGSYIGLTIRLDSFCTDFHTIYNVLDIVYRKRILGLILKNVNGGRLQYIYHSFEKVSAELAEFERYIRNTIGTALVTSDFKNIPSLPTGRGNTKINWEDAHTNYVTQIVGQNGFCSISEEYMSKSVESKLKEEYKHGALSRQSEINQLNSTVDELRKSINELQENRRANNVGVSNGQYNSGAYHHHGASHRHNDYVYHDDKSMNKIITYAVCAVLALLLLVIGYFLFEQPSTDPGIPTNTYQQSSDTTSTNKADSTTIKNDKNNN